MVENKTVGWTLVFIAITLSIVLGLFKTEYDSQATQMCQLVSEDPDINMEECPAHTSNIDWFLMVAFGIALGMLATGSYILMPELKKKTKAKFNIEGEEKQVYEILNNYEGSVYQSDIVKETGWSKVKVTRVLDKMESKGLIERRRRGMTNVIFLK